MKPADWARMSWHARAKWLRGKGATLTVAETAALATPPIPVWLAAARQARIDLADLAEETGGHIRHRLVDQRSYPGVVTP